MYFLAQKQDVVRIPPHRLGEEEGTILQELATASFEGRMEGENSFTLLVTDVEKAGEGRIVHGDGGVYQDVKYTALMFKVELNEVVSGVVCDVLKFGAFVRFGPLDGLLHISQVMDDRIDIDESNKRLLGKDTKRDIKMDDRVQTRIVAVSLNERSLRESRIGLTMRQRGLGKYDWLTEDRKKEKGEDAPKKKEKKEKKEAKE